VIEAAAIRRAQPADTFVATWQFFRKCQVRVIFGTGQCADYIANAGSRDYGAKANIAGFPYERTLAIPHRIRCAPYTSVIMSTEMAVKTRPYTLVTHMTPTARASIGPKTGKKLFTAEIVWLGKSERNNPSARKMYVHNISADNPWKASCVIQSNSSIT
jgi:hypothetical protein